MTFTARLDIIDASHLPAGFGAPYAILAEQARRLRGGYLTVSVSLPRRPRTTGPKSQSNHVWGHAQQLAEHSGHEVDEIVLYAKLRAVKRGYPVEMIGDVAVPLSQASISTGECGHLIDELHAIAAELDVALIESDDDTDGVYKPYPVEREPGDKGMNQ